MRAAISGLGRRIPADQWRTAPGVTPSISAALAVPPTDLTQSVNVFMMAGSIQNVLSESKPSRYTLDAQIGATTDSLTGMKTWNQKARELMTERDISIKAMADTLGMTPGGVGHYLSGRRQPKPGMLRKIAARIGVSVSELVEDDPSFARDQEEHDLLETFREIDPEQKASALAMLQGLKNSKARQMPPPNGPGRHDAHPSPH